MQYNEVPTRYVVLDYEADTEYGLDPWHPKYALVSCAFRVRDGDKVNNIYTTDFNEIRDLVEQAIEERYIIGVYNAGYEYPVSLAQLGLDLNKYDKLLDVMRLYQHATENYGEHRQLNLNAAASEILGIENYKESHLKPLIERGIARNLTQAHAKVTMLSETELEAYNLDDVVITEEVMLQCWVRLLNLGYDWVPDHKMYIKDVCRNTKPFLEGFRFDIMKALEGLQELRKLRDDLLSDFYVKYEKEIQETVEREAKIATQKDYETRRDAAEKRYAETQRKNKKKPNIQRIERGWVFKITSTKALTALCVGTLGMTPKFFTPGGAPSFKKDFLGQWGEVGQLLKTLSKTRKPIEELEKTIAMASHDGRVHAQTKAGLTATGRNTSGKGGL